MNGHTDPEITGLVPQAALTHAVQRAAAESNRATLAEAVVEAARNLLLHGPIDGPDRWLAELEVAVRTLDGDCACELGVDAMTVPVHTAPGKVWWLVTTHGTRVLVPAPADTNPDRVIRNALAAMGHTPTLQTMDPDGNWFTPTGPIPAFAFTRRVYPHHLTAACTARHATRTDVDLHYQTPHETRR